MTATAKLFTLFFCSLSLLLYTTSGSPPPINCRPSSCGHLANISYPFRLAGDPPSCGLSDYQLTCEEGNRTVFNLPPAGKYYVLNITYESRLIRVVDARLTSGGCSLPSQSLWPPSPLDGPFDYYGNGWMAFVNCSRMISDPMYQYVPCMSSSSTHVYHLDVGNRLDAETVMYLKPSCHAISSIPLAHDALEALASGAELSLALQMGFVMDWGRGLIKRPSKAQVIGFCWRSASRYIRQHISFSPHAHQRTSL